MEKINFEFSGKEIGKLVYDHEKQDLKIAPMEHKTAEKRAELFWDLNARNYKTWWNTSNDEIRFTADDLWKFMEAYALQESKQKEERIKELESALLEINSEYYDYGVYSKTQLCAVIYRLQGIASKAVNKDRPVETSPTPEGARTLQRIKNNEELSSEIVRLRELLGKLFGLIESGKLVRDISKDHEPDWALKQIELVRTLAEVSAALQPLERTEKN
jgi:hypothetical protein